MKKYLSAFAVCIISIFLSIHVNAFNTAVNDNFEDSDLSKYSISAKNGASVTICEDPEHGNVMNLTGSGTNIALTERKFSAVDGTVIIDIDYKRVTDEGGAIRLLQVYDSDKKNRSFLLTASSTEFVVRRGESQIKLYPSDYKVGEWMSIRAILNFKTKTYDLYINGTQYCKDWAFFYNTAPNAGIIQIQVDPISNGSIGVNYVDNFKVYAINNPISDNALLEYENLINGADMYSQTRTQMFRNVLSDVKSSTEAALSDDEQLKQKDILDSGKSSFMSGKIISNPILFYDDFSGDLSEYDIEGTAGISGGMLVLGEDAAVKVSKSFDNSFCGTVEINEAFYCKKKTPIDAVLLLKDMDGTEAVRIFSDGKDLYAGTEDSAITILENYNTDEIYNIKVCADVTQNIFTIYLNEDEKGSGKFLYKTYFPSILEFNALNEQQFCIDNIKISQSIKENEISVPLNGQTIFTAGEKDIETELMADVFDNMNLPIDLAVEWELKNGPQNVSLNNNFLTASPGAQGIAEIRAFAGEIYRDISIVFADDSKVTVNSVSAENGKITVSGKLDRKGDEDIFLNVVCDTFEESEKINDDENGIFTVEFFVDNDTPTKEFTLKASGDNVYEYSEVFMYFGQDAAQTALERINKNEDELILNTMLVFEKYLDAAQNVLKEYETEYVQRIKEKIPYSSISEFNTYAKEINVIVAVNNAERSNIESIIKENFDLLKANGFNETAFGLLNTEKKNSFYVSASNIKGNTLSEICSEMNKITDKLSKIQPANQGGGSSSGGGSSTSGNGYTVTPVKSPQSTPEPTIQPDSGEIKEFDDEDEAEWAKEAIKELRKRKIIEGDNNRLRPNDFINRGEIAKIIVTAFEIGEAGNPDNSPWWLDYAKRGEAAGIINGYDDGDFHGDDSLTRQDMAVLLERTGIYKNISFYDKNKDKKFNDDDEISDYAKNSVYALQRNGILSGVGEDMFAPKESVTRAQAIYAVFNMLLFEENKSEN